MKLDEYLSELFDFSGKKGNKIVQDCVNIFNNGIGEENNKCSTIKDIKQRCRCYVKVATILENQVIACLSKRLNECGGEACRRVVLVNLQVAKSNLQEIQEYFNFCVEKNVK